MNSPRFTGFVAASFLAVSAAISCRALAAGNTAIHVSENGHYFVDGNARPLFWQGDTEWELFHLFSVPDAETLLQRRHDQGFNVIQVMVTGVYPEWDSSKGLKPWKESQAWLDNNPLTPNEDYFKRVDTVVEAAARAGMVLVIGVYHAADQDKGRITLENAKPWAKWLATRYRHSGNVVWSMYPHAVAASEPIIRATVEGLRQGDGGIHLITMHPDPSPKSSSFMHTERWLSFNTLQSWSTDLANCDMVTADYSKRPVKPVVDGEARYEGEDGTTPLECRRAGYWACLAGGFYSYGHRDNWMSPPTWKEWWDTPGASQMKVLGDVFRSIEWWKLLPDQALLVGAAKGDLAARSADGEWILVYLTGDAPVTLRLSQLAGSPMAEGWWIDPVTGARTENGRFSITGERTFTPPRGCQDAILLIKKAGGHVS